MKFAVIGCGNIAQKSIIPALMNSGVSNISVCVDTNPEKEFEIETKFGLPFETSLIQAVNNYNFEAVYISTPNAVHKEIILQAAKNKKHILCQKSIVCTLDDAIEVVNCCKENKVVVLEGFMYQHHTQHKFIRELIKKGEIGTPFHFQAWFGFPPISQDDFRYKKTLGGGAILDAGSYTIHAARNFFNCEPCRIYSTLEYESHEVEIRGTAMLDFGDSKTAHLVFGFNNMYQNKYEIWGTEGVIKLERAFALPPNYQSTLTLIKQQLQESYSMDPCNHFIEEIRYFISNISNNEYIEKWQKEIISQMKVINQISFPDIRQSYYSVI